MRKLILLVPIVLLSICVSSFAQQSSKSKSKDRFREKNDLKYGIIEAKNVTPVNKDGTDYAPTYYDGGIVFVSSREKNGNRDPSTNETYTKLYMAPFDPNGYPTKAVLFELDANKKSDLHDGPVSFSRDRTEVYYTRTNNKKGVRKAGRDGISRFKIYKAVAGTPDWETKEELHFNSDNYNCLHPCLSPDGKHLFFASDMPSPEAQGGFDLYVVERNQVGWSMPRNLGPLVNTAGNELYPFYSSSKTLFFSSDGRPNTLGDLDIYYINNPLENPEEVVNMADPFNSPGKDIGFIIDENGKSGFWSSDRPNGVGKQDIYYFKANAGIEGVSKPEVNPVNISITSAATGKPIQGASIRILEVCDDGMRSYSSEFYEIDLVPMQDNGKANVLNFQLTLKGADSLGKVDLYSNADGKAITEFTRYRSFMVIVSYNGYRSEEKLRSVLSNDPINLNFSLREAPMCLRAGGIVSTESYGTRIENAILKFINRENDQTETVRSDRNGEFKVCLTAEGEYLVQVNRDGFKPENFRVVARKGTQEPFNEIKLRALVAAANVEETMPLASAVRDGTVFIMERVFYEYNKTTLNQGAIRYMDALVDMMTKRYPEMEVDLVVHTDTRGDARMNQVLTDERAKHSVIYLTSRGIDPKRINAYGKGEAEPRNHCVEGVECTDAQHQENNRIEIKVRRVRK